MDFQTRGFRPRRFSSFQQMDTLTHSHVTFNLYIYTVVLATAPPPGFICMRYALRQRRTGGRTQTDIQTGRHGQRQTDASRQTETGIRWRTDRDRQKDRLRNIQKDRKTASQAARQSERQRGTETERQRDRKAERQRDRREREREG